jgi:hypothetical protein
MTHPLKSRAIQTPPYKFMNPQHHFAQTPPKKKKKKKKTQKKKEIAESN